MKLPDYLSSPEGQKACLGWGYYMKMTFEIPAALALRFKASVPKGRRSVMVSRLLEGEIKSTEADLEAACERANALNLDTKDWENLNESETW